MNDRQQHYFNPAPGPYETRAHAYGLRGSELVLETAEGTFGTRGFDFGSRLLLESALDNLEARDRAPERILDMGCGNGVLGFFYKVFHPKAKLTLIDVNERAIETAKANAERLYALDWQFSKPGEHRADEVVLLNQDGLPEIKPGIARAGTFELELPHFDLCLINPPIRAGNDTVYRLYAEIRAALKDDGLMFAVIRKKQGAASHQKELLKSFENVDMIARKKGYHIYVAEGRA